MTRKEVALGIDIGGTNTKFGIVTHDGEILERSSLSTVDCPRLEDLAKKIYQFTLDWCQNSDLSLKGVGIGAPNVNYETGHIVSPPNLNWGTVDLRSIFEKQFSTSVTVFNDAKVMALAEKHFGLAKGYNDFIVLTLGTGLGSGIYTQGALLLGGNKMAAEAGHITLYPEGRPCHCGGKGHFEAYVSSSGILQTAKELFPAIQFSSPRDLFEKANSGSREAQEVLAQTGRYLGMGAGLLATLFAPKVFILSGGISQAADYFLGQTQESLNETIFPPFRGHSMVYVSQFGPKIGGIIGAASLAWHGL